MLSFPTVSRTWLGLILLASFQLKAQGSRLVMFYLWFGSQSRNIKNANGCYRVYKVRGCMPSTDVVCLHFHQSKDRKVEEKVIKASNNLFINMKRVERNRNENDIKISWEELAWSFRRFLSSSSRVRAESELKFRNKREFSLISSSYLILKC